MKQFFLLLLVISTATCFGQENKKTISKLYAELGGGSTNRDGSFASLGVRAVLANNWTFGLLCQGVGVDAHNLPSDYVPTMGLILIIPYSEGNPSANMNVFSLTAGRFFPAGRKVWFTADGGLTVIRGSEFTFTRRTTNNGSFLEFPSNYTYKEDRKLTAGVMLHAGVNWAFASAVGVGTGVFANINGLQSLVGLQIKLLVGKMNVSGNR